MTKLEISIANKSNTFCTVAFRSLIFFRCQISSLTPPSNSEFGPYQPVNKEIKYVIGMIVSIRSVNTSPSAVFRAVGESIALSFLYTGSILSYRR